MAVRFADALAERVERGLAEQGTDPPRSSPA
jgi:hypothetical protein